MGSFKSAWLIQAHTNIQVGNEGASSIGLIDKEVQRDILTTIPCINASSLKGAMNEYATVVAKLSPNHRIAIFGSDKENTSSKATRKGSCSFFDAKLLLLPVQDDMRMYKLVTSREVLSDYVAILNLLGINLLYDGLVKILETVDNHFVSRDCIIEFGDFKELCSNLNLPIIARNCVSNSGNLWYEQVLPQKSVFGTLLLADSSLVYMKSGEDKIVIDIADTINATFKDKVVQIGANATIGYGYCEFMNIYQENQCHE